MSKRHEKIFHQRGHRDGKQTHENVLIVIIHQGNAN